MKIIWILIFICSMFSSFSSLASTFDKGWELISQQEYESARKIFSELVESGDANGIYGLGIMNHFGYGMAENHQIASALYLTAAKKGVVGAMHNIGFMYRHGQGVMQSNKKAVYWYQKAAELGFGAAQHDLGFMYSNGFGVEIDHVKAFELYENALKQKVPLAMLSIGISYYYGYGVPVNYVDSYAYIKAAELLGISEIEPVIKLPRIKLQSNDIVDAEKRAKQLVNKYFPQ